MEPGAAALWERAQPSRPSALACSTALGSCAIPAFDGNSPARSPTLAFSELVEFESTESPEWCAQLLLIEGGKAAEESNNTQITPIKGSGTVYKDSTFV